MACHKPDFIASNFMENYIGMKWVNLAYLFSLARFCGPGNGSG